MIGRIRRSSFWNQKATVIGLIAMALISLFALRVLYSVDWDATVFTGFGEDETKTREYAEERLGEVFLRSGEGHDGKYFFVQANDPWLLEPEENIAVVDRPLYRSQRMFYPVLAGAGGAFEPNVIIWALLAINVLAMGAGTWATALVAQRMAVSPWWGLAFVLNIGFISELIIDGSGIVAAAAAFGAVALILSNRFRWGVVLLVLAALTREAMLITAVGCAWWLWRERGQLRKAIVVVSVPVAAVVVWGLYSRMRIGWAAGISQVKEIGLPFVGFARAVSTWIGDPVDVAIGFVLMALLVVFGARASKSRALVGWAFAGFVVLGLIMTERVWVNYFDITRAIAPLITAFALLVAASIKAPRDTEILT